MSARSIAQYARKHPTVVSDVEQASDRERTEAEIRRFEVAAPVEAKKLRHAARRYYTTDGGLVAKVELYQAAMALAKAVR